MKVPYVIITEELIPEVRRRVSIELGRRGWSQGRIAGILGISQVMVSRYFHEERIPSVSLNSMIETVSRDMVSGALSGESHEEISIRFCTSVERCMKEGMLAERFRERFSMEPYPSCFGMGLGTSGRSAVLRDLSAALELLKGKDLSFLVPALKVNMAQTWEGGKSIGDVASFPGRLIDRNGKIVSASSAEFGCSKHLAGILLSAHGSHPSVLSVASFRFNDEISAAIPEEEGLAVLDRGEMTLEDLIGRAPLDDGGFVADPGDFGVEPCLYIFGRSSLDVALRALDLNERVGRCRSEGSKGGNDPHRDMNK
ncbi:MAG TPA: hypothetical protein ENK47_04505 [Euryarchaeota archaeon]|nr:MAG: hypothetical protein B6U90_03820 [Thermoplasmatales archaeon ex4484_6]RLF66760.1 MAG: hypothetical protein DRN57_06425 [Thermoplasmata archaeon]HHD15948.1 hypothetical protein [Euryarchaeota archaeon]